MSNQIIDKALAYLAEPYVKIVERVPLGTVSFNSAGAAEKTMDVSQYIPSGYKLAMAVPRESGNYGTYFYSCRIVTGNTVNIVLFRGTGSATSTTPTIEIICIKA